MPKKGSGHQTAPKRTPPNGHAVLLYSVPAAVVDFLKGHGDQDYTPDEIAEGVGVDKGIVGRSCRRLAGHGKGSGPVRRTKRGFFQYSDDNKEPVLDQFIKSARPGIENFLIIKCAPACVRTPPTPSQTDTMHNTGLDTKRTPPLLYSTDTADTKTDTKRTPIPKKGYPILLPSGQRVEWHQYPSSDQEMIHFIADGQGPFPLELILYLIGQLKKDGLDNTWTVVSVEWNFDSRRFSVPDPMQLQVAEGLLMKFYQHGALARLEIADRRPIPSSDIFLTILEAVDRGAGTTALRKAGTLEKMVENIGADNRKLHRWMENLSDKVHDIDRRKRGRPRDRPPGEGKIA